MKTQGTENNFGKLFVYQLPGNSSIVSFGKQIKTDGTRIILVNYWLSASSKQFESKFLEIG